MEAATWGAYYNVMINLNSVKDEPLKSNVSNDNFNTQLACIILYEDEPKTS